MIEIGIKIGKTYRTRGGFNVFIDAKSFDSPARIWGHRSEETKTRTICWHESGLLSPPSHSEYDIIVEVVDAPAAPFELGQIVTTKMLGPQMTVENVNGGVISCVWFDARNRLHRDAFDAIALKPVVGMP